MGWTGLESFLALALLYNHACRDIQQEIRFMQTLHRFYCRSYSQQTFQTDLCNFPCLNLSHSFSVFLRRQEYWFSWVNPLNPYPCVFNWDLFNNKICVCFLTSPYIQHSAHASLAEVLIASLWPPCNPTVVHDDGSLTDNWKLCLSISCIRQRSKNGEICKGTLI